MTRKLGAIGGMLGIISGIMAISAPVRAETIEAAMAKAWQHNPELAAARSSVLVTAEQVARARAGYRPNLRAGASYGLEYSTSSFSGGNARPESESLSLSQPLFQGGGTVAAVAQAKAQTDSVLAQLKAVEQDILLQTANVYLNVISAEATVRLRENDVTVLQKQLDASNARFKVGEITKTDVAQSGSRLSRAQADLATARGVLQTLRAEYARLVGDAPESLTKVTTTLPLPQSRDEASEMALSRNPQILRAEYDRKAADKAVDAAKSALLPDLSLEAQASRRDGGNGFNSASEDYSVTAQLNIPLYQSGAEYAAIRSAKYGSRQAQQSRDAAERSVTAQALAAWEDWMAAKSTIVARKDQVESSELALTGVRRENEVGSRTILDVLDAEQELLDARVALIEAERVERSTAYSLLVATGGMNARDLKLEVTDSEIEDLAKKAGKRWIGSGIGAE